MSYANVIKGGLKLKGGDVSVTKKKKKKKDLQEIALSADKQAAQADAEPEETYIAPKTEAEASRELARKKRVEQSIGVSLKKTHRERMEDFNQHLGSLSEHFDIPKVGPG
eukprot:GEMP01092431.1.p1 GENE.GEMP01092431.1~~GEMP01092431.1.p1  ORF type:complete len:110 (+),score=28.81 GEMP01092431.1:90-419(+)